jgi:phosphoribosylformimino-5-aminoimidazole carboxamide ribotide isomerase
MIVYPAIDLRNGRCVRLSQGRFDTAIEYDPDPLAVARRFASAGVSHLHVVDLDGAQAEQTRQISLILAIARDCGLTVQAGGGLRTEDHVAQLLDGGVARAIVGSIAVRDPQLVIRLLRRFGGDRIVVALDIRLVDGEPRVETAGWQAGALVTVAEVLAPLADRDLRHVLCTDIGRDGMLAGPNVELYRGLKTRYPGICWIASGGVGSLADLSALEATGVVGVIVGKALYEGRFTIAEALAHVREGPRAC